MRFLFCLALLSLSSCYETTRNCNDYKTGAYRFDYNVDGVAKSGDFKRTERYSINFYDGKTDSSEVKWINDCEFILYKINPKSISEKDPIHMKILTTTDSSYTFEYAKASFNEGEKKRKEKGIAYRIK
ncbi:MAG: hypothetical protein P8K68_07085 [Algibacter sp.]|uniref:hypothetical protein n=1 Tax=Algibacter sp. TaxID=1872428 RepID=UPI002620C62F|nr:hypothetical protein [Algibacter sp.]MDG1728599.1 hypothetical protein [Algibacter sp.]MDG2178539.1 hypothetical protein [Algibacter sp.]